MLDTEFDRLPIRAKNEILDTILIVHIISTKFSSVSA